MSFQPSRQPRGARAAGGRAEAHGGSYRDRQEQAAIWPRVVASSKNFAGYQNKTNRDIPVVTLTPAGNGT